MGQSADGTEDRIASSGDQPVIGPLAAEVVALRIRGVNDESLD